LASATATTSDWETYREMLARYILPIRPIPTIPI
jgi:hypothetical protein